MRRPACIMGKAETGLNECCRTREGNLEIVAGTKRGEEFRKLGMSLKFTLEIERSLNILKVLSNTLWGANRVSLLLVYQAQILSRLHYGCVVYGSARASVLRRLDTIHHSALVRFAHRRYKVSTSLATNFL
ncbi:RNase H domain-containing protein [Trichonephila clavipes]|nr:RNase H domain-containing protein [Trichonephila clavipes]